MSATNKPVLLSDDQVRRFLTHGYLVLKPTLPRSFHEGVYEQLGPVIAKGNPGNNILPHIPQLQAVFDDPIVRGALTSVLGTGWIMHPSRYAHENTKSDGGPWHKDSYWGYRAMQRRVRHHRPWWVMVMYYPQDTPLEMGPTAVLPGRQAHLTRAEDDERGAASVTGEAGTCFMIHYDLWHRASPRVPGKARYMLKFEFLRMEVPQGPTWDCRERGWRDPQDDPPVFSHRAMWRDQWRWLTRNVNGDALPSDGNAGRWIDALGSTDSMTRMRAADELSLRGRGASDAIAPLTTMLQDEFEPAALNAAYALAAIGAEAITALRQALHGSHKHAALNAAHALAAMGTAAVPTLVDAVASDSNVTRMLAAYALGEINPTDNDTSRALARVAQDRDALVRLNAAEALGWKREAASIAIPALTERLRDEDTEVRFNAVISLGRLGPAAAEAVPVLTDCLLQDNRYIRGFAVEALHRVGTPEAIAALLSHLKATRWCPFTTSDSPYYP